MRGPAGVALYFLHDLFVDPLGKELGVRDALPASETFEQENVLRIKPEGDRLAGGPTQLVHLRSVELSSRLSFGFPGRCRIPSHRFLPKHLGNLVRQS